MGKRGHRSGEYRQCQRCGEAFYLYPNDLKRGRGLYCSRKCQLSTYRGEGNPKWRGGRYVSSSGYVYAHAPDHPYATKQGYVMEHRLVMEQQVGRYLKPEEQVHHINHIRDDNRPENLQLMADIDAHRIRHAYYVEEPCGSCGTPIKRSLAHRRRYTKGFCSRRCAALAGSRAAAEQASHLRRSRDSAGRFTKEAK